MGRKGKDDNEAKHYQTINYLSEPPKAGFAAAKVEGKFTTSVVQP
jgi:hypothetical protein